jgi:membrane protein YqaA with SNARE-associated domain
MEALLPLDLIRDPVSLNGYSEFGAYLALFIVSFIAATLIPLGSEIVLLGLVESGLSPVPCLLVASVGNICGSLMNYGLGIWLGHKLLQPNRWIEPDKLQRGIDHYQRWGLPSQLLAWVPIIGDPLTFAAGVLRVNIWGFILLVSIGKVGRYYALIAANI